MTWPLFVHLDVHPSWLRFTRWVRQPQRLIVPQALRKRRERLRSFCLRNCSRCPMGDVTLPEGSGYKIQCLNFADARLAVLDLLVAHENLELPDRSSSYRNCRCGAA